MGVIKLYEGGNCLDADPYLDIQMQYSVKSFLRIGWLIVIS